MSCKYFSQVQSCYRLHWNCGWNPLCFRSGSYVLVQLQVTSPSISWLVLFLRNILLYFRHLWWQGEWYFHSTELWLSQLPPAPWWSSGGQGFQNSRHAQCTLSIPPSKHSNLQMTARNVWHFQYYECENLCKQVIKGIKDFYILKRELRYSLLPIVHFRVCYDCWIKEVKTHFLQS